MTIGIFAVARLAASTAGVPQVRIRSTGECNELGRQRRIAAVVALRPAIIEPDVFSFDPAEPAQPLLEALDRAQRRRSKHPDAPYLCRVVAHEPVPPAANRRAVPQARAKAPAIERRPPNARSFDDLVGAREARWRDREAERLGSVEVDDQLEGRGLLDRQIGRFGAGENPARLGDTCRRGSVRRPTTSQNFDRS